MIELIKVYSTIPSCLKYAYDTQEDTCQWIFYWTITFTRNINKRYIIIQPHETKMIPTDIESARDCGFMLYA